MNTFGHLPLQESMAQRGAGKHDRWQGYMTILVVNHGSVKSINILTAVICLMVKFVVDTARDYFHQEVQWTLAILQQHSTLTALDLRRVHYLPHALQQE
jgi:hypothetical protein